MWQNNTWVILKLMILNNACKHTEDTICVLQTSKYIIDNFLNPFNCTK